MAEYVAIRNGGKTDEEGATRLLRKLAGTQYQGIVGTSDMAVSQNGTPNMSVNVSTGDIVIPYLNYFFHGWIDATKNVTVNASDPTNGRRDRVVAYIDLSVVSSASSNNPGALKFKAVAGTPSGSPVYPDDTAVQTSVGAGNPWVEIGRIVVGATVTTIVTGNLTQTQPLFQLGGGVGGIQFAVIGQMSVLNDVTPYWVAPKNGTFTSIYGRVKTAPTGQALNGRINKNGTQVATFTISASSLTVTPQTGLSLSFVAGDYFNLDITQVGSTIAGSDLTLAVG
jgi:hypothetical protein